MKNILAFLFFELRSLFPCIVQLFAAAFEIVLFIFVRFQYYIFFFSDNPAFQVFVFLVQLLNGFRQAVFGMRFQPSARLILELFRHGVRQALFDQVIQFGLCKGLFQYIDRAGLQNRIGSKDAFPSLSHDHLPGLLRFTFQVHRLHFEVILPGLLEVLHQIGVTGKDLCIKTLLFCSR